jgi:hypothetical protein
MTRTAKMRKIPRRRMTHLKILPQKKTLRKTHPPKTALLPQMRTQSTLQRRRLSLLPLSPSLRPSLLPRLSLHWLLLRRPRRPPFPSNAVRTGIAALTISSTGDR